MEQEVGNVKEMIPARQCSHFRLMKFFCVTCRKDTCQRCLENFHMTHEFCISLGYLMKLKDEKISEWNEKLDGVIKEIKKARKSFSEDVNTVKVRIVSNENPFRELQKMAMLRIVQEIETIQTLKWQNQEAKCLTLRKKWNKEVKQASSIFCLNLLINNMILEFQRVMFVEPCKVYKINKGAELMKLGGIRMSPSAKKTKVMSNGKFFINEINTCTVEVKNEINEMVENDVKYKLTVKLITEEGQIVPVIIKNEKNGCFKIMFYPSSPCLHNLFVSINSIPVAGTPLDLVLANPSRCEPYYITFGKPGTGDGEFAKPWGVCCDPDGKIYVADRLNHRIQIFTANGRFIGKFGSMGDGPGEFNRPTGIAADSHRRIIVADKDNHRIQIFRSNGDYINHFGRFETEEESLNYPWGVAVNRQDQIAVTEGKKHRVRLFTYEGIRLAECVFTPEMELYFPRGVASLPHGSFLVTDFERHKIVYLDDEFKPFATLGSQGDGIEHFFRPQGIAVSGNRMFAVSDCRNKRIKIYRRDEMPQIIGDCFEKPEGIAFNMEDSLIVVDSEENKVKIFPNKTICPSDYYFPDST